MIQVAIFVCVGWLLSVCLHEFGHAIVAYWGGDTSVKDKGYLTLNPIKYTDINLSLILPLFFLLLGGIPLPGAAVYINEGRLRSRFWKSAVSAAGPLASIMVALLLALAFNLTFSSSNSNNIIEFLPDSNWQINSYSWIWPAIAFLTFLEVFVVILNLLPIPALDGYGIIEPWLPSGIQKELNKFRKYGIFVLFALLWFVKPVSRFLSDSAMEITAKLGIPSAMISIGYSLFNQWAIPLLIVAIAIAAIARKITQKPEDAWYEKGMGKIRRKKYEEAIADFDQAIRFNNDFDQAWMMRGEALLQLERYEDAIAAYDQTIKINPQYWQAWYYRGIALESLQRSEEAIESWRKAAEIEPDSNFSWCKVGEILSNLQRYQEAVVAYDKALEIKPNDAMIWAQKAIAFGYQKQYDAAIAACDRAIKINPRFLLAWYNKAGCYAEQENVELAIENLRQAVKIDRVKVKELAEKDPSFDLIRNHPEFKKLLDK